MPEQEARGLCEAKRKVDCYHGQSSVPPNERVGVPNASGGNSAMHARRDEMAAALWEDFVGNHHDAAENDFEEDHPDFGAFD